MVAELWLLIQGVVHKVMVKVHQGHAQEKEKQGEMRLDWTDLRVIMYDLGDPKKSSSVNGESLIV